MSAAVPSSTDGCLLLGDAAAARGSTLRMAALNRVSQGAWGSLFSLKFDGEA
jgi:hypothetical protein